MYRLLQIPNWLGGVGVALRILFCLVPFLFLARLGAEDSAGKVVLKPTPAPVSNCMPGPWGDLEYVRTTLEPPDHYAAESVAHVSETHWFFKGYNLASVTNYFTTLGLPPEQVNNFFRKAICMSGTNGVWIAPEEQFVLNLNSDVRAKLYTLLASFEENGVFHTPYLFRSETLNERFNRSGLSDKTVAMVKSLLYPRGTLVAFADIAAAMSQIPDSQEKIRLAKVLSRKCTIMLRLKLTEHTDVTRLAEYWGAGTRAKDLKPLLESLTRVDGGWEIDVANLLPPLARARLYTYPSPSKEQGGPHDNCHWSSFNFFNDPPDNGFREASKVQKAIDEDYDVVVGNKQLGDVVLVMDANNSILHSASYIADDIVFTKTGGRENQPWILMKTDDMLPLYATAKQPLRIVVCRKKAFSERSLQ